MLQERGLETAGGELWLFGSIRPRNRSTNRNRRGLENNFVGMGEAQGDCERTEQKHSAAATNRCVDAHTHHMPSSISNKRASHHTTSLTTPQVSMPCVLTKTTTSARSMRARPVRVPPPPAPPVHAPPPPTRKTLSHHVREHATPTTTKTCASAQQRRPTD